MRARDRSRTAPPYGVRRKSQRRPVRGLTTDQCGRSSCKLHLEIHTPVELPPARSWLGRGRLARTPRDFLSQSLEGARRLPKLPYQGLLPSDLKIGVADD